MVLVLLYEEAMVTGKSARGKRMARATAWGLNGFLMGLAVPPVRWLLGKSYFTLNPARGLVKKDQLNGEYDLVFLGTTPAGDKIKCRVTGDRDPGYGSTAKMLAQSAACSRSGCAKNNSWRILDTSYSIGRQAYRTITGACWNYLCSRITLTFQMGKI